MATGWFAPAFIGARRVRGAAAPRRAAPESLVARRRVCLSRYREFGTDWGLGADG